jgi:glycosyl-4,4'-diaponeurosporenoate acyltransferase
MRIFFFSPILTLIVDVISWVVIHLSIGFTCSQIPVSFFSPDKWLYQTYGWEQSGEIYQRFFRVRSWKGHVPAGGSIYPNYFSIQKLPSFDKPYLERWIKESCRSEFCHWLMIPPGVFFFVWNSILVGWFMLIYAVLNNIVPIIMQRYNRPRIIRIISRIGERVSGTE